MRRYIESALRLRVRLLISGILVFAVAFAALYMSKQGYSSSATVWVEQPIYLKDQTSFNPYITPAQNQANVFSELLLTRQFTLDIAKNAGMPLATRAQQDRAVEDIQHSLKVAAQGSYLVSMTYSSDKPTFCRPVIDQAIKLFINEINSSRTQQADVALQLYREQQSTYEAVMSKSRDALDQYIKANPDALTAGTQANPTLNDLQQQYLSDRSHYDDITNKINDLLNQTQAVPQVNDQFFRVFDAPTEAQAYKLTSKDLTRNSLLALVMGLLAVVGVGLVGTWTDSAIYTLNDLNTVLLTEDGSNAGMVVASLPYFPPLGIVRKQAERLTRRATRQAASLASAPAAELESGSAPSSSTELEPNAPEVEPAAPDPAESHVDAPVAVQR